MFATVLVIVAIILTALIFLGVLAHVMLDVARPFCPYTRCAVGDGH